MVNENESTIADETGPTEPESPVESPVEVPVLSEDVWKAAYAVALKLDVAMFTGHVTMIADAIAAERERCANVCIKFPYEHKIVGERYAAAIRKGEA
jgi:hypothetical protein